MQKRHLLTLALSLTIPIVASAQSFTTQHLGSFDYYYGDDGSSAVGQRLGNFYYLNGTDRCGHSYSATGQRIGNFEYWDYQR